MDEVRIHSWNELQEQLYEGSWRPELRRFRSPFAFRGQPVAQDDLETSLARLGGSYEKMERHLLRNFRKYAHLSNVEDDSVWNWLSLAKHHGLPTRLLDWSFSPFVAMHFATANIERYDRDAAIWKANYIKVHQYLPKELKAVLEQEGSDVFTVEMLSKVVDTLKTLDTLCDAEFAVFFEPPSMDERIVNQHALFSMMTNARATLNRWLEQDASLCRKVIIPADLKWEIRDKLDQANITERVLFPGLDGLSAWLKRQYSQRMD
jgi:hypothetical protein